MEVGVEESIVNEPVVLQTLIFQIADFKNANNAKNEVRFKQLINPSFKKTEFSNCILKTRKK
jgi:hypothetical protein